MSYGTAKVLSNYLSHKLWHSQGPNCLSHDLWNYKVLTTYLSHELRHGQGPK